MARRDGSRIPRGIFEKVPGSGIWWIRYADERHRERREIAGTKAQARSLYERRKAEVRLRVKHPELAAENSAAVTFGEISDDALAYCRRHANYHNDVIRAERMCEWWRDLPATALTPQEIELRFASMTTRGNNWKQKRPLSGASRNRYRSQLSLTYQLAQKYGKVPLGFNPARLVTLCKENPRVRWLSAEEEKRLREVLEREYPHRPWAHLLDIALNCGLRWGDQGKLTAAEREGDLLRVRINKTEQPIGLRLNSIAAAAWEALEAEAGEDGRLSPVKNTRSWFQRALRLAGIEDFRWHDLRHTYATRLLQAGVPAEKVQGLLGHRSIAMTLRYAHVVDGYQEDALGRLAEINRRCAAGGAPVVSMPLAGRKAQKAGRHR